MLATCDSVWNNALLTIIYLGLCGANAALGARQCLSVDDKTILPATDTLLLCFN